MIMDCRNWDEDSYRQSILHEREASSRTVFRTIFAPSTNPNPDIIVNASSDGIISSYSISSCLAMGCGNARSQKSIVAEPIFLIQAHDGPAYDVQFYGSDNDSLLLSCGDDGQIKGWKWKEISESNSDLKPVLNMMNPQHKGPWGALSPIPENNAIAVDTQSKSIFIAAGDSYAYCWDVETGKIKMTFKGHTDFLHCITARNSHHQIITGSEDGTARIWDCRSGKCIQVIDSIKDKKTHVSCIALDASESWLACGSGNSLSIWNLSARECVTKINTRASIQDVLFDDNQILSVGAEPILNRYNMDGKIVSKIQCAPCSTFSIALHSSGVTAVSGYGSLVDIISQFGSHLCVFGCKGL